MTSHTAYICDAVRTPFGRYGGALSSVRADDLAAIVLRELCARHAGIDWRALDDVILGCANQAGEDNRNVARMALLLAGLPLEVPGATVNRLCGSSLDAVAGAARLIATGDASLVIAGGVESMSRAPFVLPKSDAPFSRSLKLEDTTMGWRLVNPAMQRAYGTDSMPETGEHVAAEFKVSRADQDAFAFRSQQRASAAIASGAMAEEIVPVTVQDKGLSRRSPKGEGGPLVVSVDEHPRADTTLDGLAKLKPVVKADGTITAGNASGVNDGASAILVASETAAKTFGLTPLARVVTSAVVGVEPRTMGMGPVPATRKVLARAGLRLDQMDVIEVNEAFASQAVAVLRELGVPEDAPHVNPNGGAIAIGHPLGASGGRLVATATRQLIRTKGRYALCTMCIGVGQGIALVIERV
jgi:acetyl-CoA acyltransferase